MTGVFHVLIGTLGLAFALLVLRADPRRWDNRAFAVLGALDALMALYRGIAGGSGIDIADRSVMWPCAALSPLLAWWSVEFAYSFPRSRRLPWKWRLPLLVATASVLGLFLRYSQHRWATIAAELTYFVPLTFVMVGLAWRNLRRHTGERFGVQLLLCAVLLRWLSANALYLLYGIVNIATWRTLLWTESTFIVLVAMVLISYANLRSNLFTVRSAIGELAFHIAFIVSALLLTAVALEGAQRIAEAWPEVQRPVMMVACLVPLGVYAISVRVRPRLEASVDPRGALQREVLDRTLRGVDEGDPDALIAAAVAALREISAGGAARFVALSDVPGDLATEVARRDDEPFSSSGFGAPAQLVARVRHLDRIDGVVALAGGLHDRESARAAQVLAGRIAMAYEYRRVVGALEEARRLAALGAFAAAIAHDIRTPLTSVKMNVQILRKKSALPADDMEHFDIALDELDRLEDHVKELLDYAKPMQLYRERVTVGDLADEAARTVGPILAERGQHLACDHARDLPQVSVDPQRLKQVLWNLLENAAKASPEGATIALHTRRDGDRVAIQVADRGSGIAAKDLPHIFEPFFTTRPDGTGLGLAICHKVIKAHAGEIQVESQPAHGSTFTVLLPA